MFNEWGHSYVQKRIDEEMSKIKREKDKYKSKDVISVLVNLRYNHINDEELDQFSKQ